MNADLAALDGLINEMPSIEAHAASLQGDRARLPDAAAIQALRDEYLNWYTRCLPLVPEVVNAKFRDLYEGGNFIRRIRAYLEAPMGRSSLVKPDANPTEPTLFSYWANPFDTTFRPSFFGQQQVLRETIGTAKAAIAPDAATRVEAMVRRFPLVLMELNRRRGDAAITIANEYDLQDVVRGLLVAWFDDVRPEEWTPSYAGGSSRMDFLLKAEQVVVETKLSGEGTGARDIRDQLGVDLLRYQAHPDCQILVCFVFDPRMRIANPRGFEQDLSIPQGRLEVLVAVVQ